MVCVCGGGGGGVVYTDNQLEWAYITTYQFTMNINDVYLTSYESVFELPVQAIGSQYRMSFLGPSFRQNLICSRGWVIATRRRLLSPVEQDLVNRL